MSGHPEELEDDQDVPLRAMLGLATTDELIHEILTRLRMDLFQAGSDISAGTTIEARDKLHDVRVLLTPGQRNYRTIDG